MSVLLTTKKIINEWTDYNNHMNLSFYIMIFDMGAEQILSKFKIKTILLGGCLTVMNLWGLLTGGVWVCSALIRKNWT